MRNPVVAAATALSIFFLAGCGSSGTTTASAPESTSVADTSNASEVATEQTEAATVETSEAAPISGGALAIGAPADFDWSGGATGTATVLGFERKTEPGVSFAGPPMNGYYLIVDVAMTSTEGQVSANPLYWKVKDPDGRAYNASLGAGGYEPQLESGDVPTGRTTRGLVAFDVPAGPMTLQLSPPIGSTLASWAIPDGPGGPATVQLTAGGTDQALAIGSTADFSWGSQGKGTATVFTAENRDQSNASFNGPPKNGRFLLLDVGVTATEGTISANPLYWEAVDTQGQSYGAELGSAGYSPQLDSGDLTAGSTARGYVVFDAPAGPLTIDLTDPLGGVLASWAVPDGIASGPPAATAGAASNPAATGFGDLGLTVPITQPACDGTGIVLLVASVSPTSYASEVQAGLDANPGASYLRTDHSCSSLNQATPEGNAIYAVYRAAGSTKSEVCAAVRAEGGNAYGKWLDNTTPPDSRIDCG